MIFHDWRLRQHSNRISSHLSDKHFSMLRYLDERPVRETYKLLEFYYQQNGLYEEIGDFLVSAGMTYANVRGLRNPANRVVEAYADNLWSGPLDMAMMIVSENAKLSDGIKKIWEWSNWGRLKQRAARWFGLFGDLFVKVATNAKKDEQGFSRVYLQLIKPEQVTNYKLDERGFVTSIRLDQLIQGEKGLKWHTEHWDKASQRMRIWEHSKGFDKSLDGLGKPQTDAEFSQFGIDFVPFVFCPLRDDGLGRCAGAFTHALDKINEANENATTLHKRLYRYNRPDWALEGTGSDSAGRPLPPPRMGTGEDNEIEITGERFYRLPSGWKVSSLIAQLDYASALDILNAHMRELENDLPELVYDRLKDKEGISGRALRIIAGKALKRFEEARGNASEAFTRAHSMALTMGANAGFWDAGSYEAGDFAHSLRFPEIVPITIEERATAFTMLVNGGAPVRWSLKQAGWSDADLEEFDKEMEDARRRDEPSAGTESGIPDESDESGVSNESDE